MAKEKLATLVLSEMAGDLGVTISATDTEESLKALILSKIPTPLKGDALKLSCENRELKLDALVGKKITPAVANVLKLRFCQPEKALILSEGSGFSDGFNDVMEVLAVLPDLDINLSEKSGRQVQHLDKQNETQPDSVATAFENVVNDRAKAQAAG